MGIPFGATRVDDSAGKKRPVVWRRKDGGWASFFRRAGRQGGFAYGRAGNVYCVGNNGETGIYNQITHQLTEQTTTGKICGNVAQTISTNVWFHSTGAALITARPNTDTGFSLYRTTDWITWTKVLDLRTDLSAPNDLSKVVTLAEMDNGWIVGCTYGTAGPPDSYNSSAIIRSKDAGLTWEVLTSFDRTYHSRHMHSVVWDKYRNVLWAMGGDDLMSSDIGYSTDYGDTFNNWSTTWQCTGLLPAPKGIFLLSDHNNFSYRAHRIPGSTLAELLATTFTYDDHIAYNPVAQHPLRTGLTLVQAGFAWWGWYDEALGVVYAGFNSNGYESVLAGSCDDDGSGSEAWIPVDWSASIGSGVNEMFGGANNNANPPNPYDTQWDGWHYSSTNSLEATFAWRVVPPDFVIHVDQTSGKEYGDGSADDPINWIPQNVTPWSRRIKLLSDYTGSVFLGNQGTTVDVNGFALGSAITGTLDVDQTFSSGASAPSGWAAETASSGVLTWNDTTRAYDGTYAVKCDVTTSDSSAARARKLSAGLTALTDGQEQWVRFFYYLNEASLLATCDIVQWVNQGSALQIKNVTSREGVATPTLSFLSSDSISYEADPWGLVPFPLQQWVEVTARIKASGGTGSVYAGEVDAWINGKLAISIRGVKTRYDTGMASVSFGLSNKAASASARTAWVDLVQIAHGTNAFDPRKPSTYQMKNTSQRILPAGIDS